MSQQPSNRAQEHHVSRSECSPSQGDQQQIAELADEYIERIQGGEQPSIEDYAAQYPQLAEGIRELFPTLAMLEQVAPSSPNCQRSEVAEPDTGGNLEPGTLETVGEYRLLREIGRGGMGVVYEALQPSLRRRAAVKVLPPEFGRRAAAPERFRLEARAAAQMNHPHIVPIYEVGSDQGVLYYAMQLIRGASLDHIIKALRTLHRENCVPASGGPPTRRTPQSKTDNDSITAAARDAPRADDASQAAVGLLTDFGKPDAEQLAPPTSAAREKATADGGRSTIKAAANLAEVDTVAGGPRRGRRDWRPYYRNAARIVYEIAQALAYAHRQGIVHRDVKPSNVLLDFENHVWITDFGLAKADGVGLTQTGEFVGTLRYMAPERFQGWSDPRSDVYSLGATLYEMLAFRPCFEVNDHAATIQQVLHGEPIRLRLIYPAIPRDLETIVLKSLEKEPQHRYQSAEQLAEDLKRFLQQRPLATRRISWRDQIWRWTRRNSKLAAALLLSLLLLVALTVVGFVSAAIYQDIAASEGASHQRALAANRKAESRQLQLLEAEGHRHEAQGDLLAALPFYTEALRIAHANFWPLDNHQLRLNRLLRQSPRVEQAWLLPAEDGRSVLFSPDGESILSTPLARNQAPDHDWARPQTAWLLRARGGAPIALEGHSAAICDVAFSPDSRYLATAGHDGLVVVWKTHTGRPDGKPLRHEGPVNGVAIRGDSAQLATASEDHRARVFDIASRRLLRELRHESPVTFVAFAADDLVVTADAKTICFWREERCVHSVDRLRNTRQLALVDEGRQLVTLGDRTIQSWSLPVDGPPKPSKSLRAPHAYGLHPAIVQRDGRRVLVYTGRDPWAQLWNLRTRQPLSWHVRQQDRILFAAFRDDGLFFLTAGADHVARIWDARTGEPASAPLRHHQRVVAAAFSPDRHQIATCDASGVVRLWRLPGQASLPPDISLQHFDGNPANPLLKAAAFGPRAGHLVTTAGRWTRIWSSSGERLSTIEHPAQVRMTAISPNRQLLLAAIEGATVIQGRRMRHYRISMWDLNSGRQCWQDANRFIGSRMSVARFSNDGRRIAVAWGKQVVVLDAQSGDTFAGPLRHEHLVDDVDFSPAGGYLVASASNVAMTRGPSWVTRPQMQPTTPLQTGAGTARKARVDAPRRPATMRRTPSIAPAGQVIVWDLAGGDRVKQLTPKRGLAGRVRFSPDANWIVLNCSHGGLNWAGIEVLDWQSGEIAGALRHFDTIDSMRISPAGDRLLTTSLDGTARVWSFPACRPLAHRMRHEGNVGQGVWHPSGNRLLTVAGNQVVLWDAASCRRLAVLPHPFPVLDAAFDTTETRILTSCMDGRARCWNLTSPPRTVQHWSRTSAVHSGLHIDAGGAAVPLTLNEFRRAWSEHRNR